MPATTPLWVVAGLPVVALLLWLRSLSDIDLRAMDDLGLVSVLPPLTLVALAILTVSFCFVLRTFPSNTPLMLLHIGILILMLYGATTLVEDVPRFAVSWRHAGIADHIVQNGSVDPRIDAYFNWPGFFIWAAFLTEVAGFENPISFARWATVYSNLLLLAPLVLILRAATDNVRLVWLAVWIFFLANWVGQDYFAPQAFTYFLYLVILAILLTWFTRGKRVRTDAPKQRVTTTQKVRQWLAGVGSLWFGTLEERHNDVAVRAATRVGLMAMTVLIFAVMVASHQLTPFLAVISVTALVIVGRCRARSLPVLMAVVLATWLVFMTVAYLKGHLTELTSGLGDVSANAGANVGNRLRGTPEHLFVLRVRLLFTAGLWGLALLGAARRFRQGHRDLTWGVLALAPFALMGMQSYGGEILLRIYLFALPFVAFFAAAFFLPSRHFRYTWGRTVLVGVCSVGMITALLFSRYGNERANQFTSSEIKAIEQLYFMAPKGSLLLAGSENVPWQSRHYREYRHLPLTVLAEYLQQPLPRIEDVEWMLTDRPDRSVFVIISRSQKAHVELLGIWPPGALDGLERQLAASPHFELVYANRDATLFRSSAADRRSEP